MKFEFNTPETDIVDTYTVSEIVPAMQRERSYEVIRVRVSLTVAQKDNAEDDLVAGDIMAQVDMIGYALTKQGQRVKGQGSTHVFGMREDETRYEIARQALLASCERHGLNPTKVVDHPIATFDEYQEQMQINLRQRFGIQEG